MARPLFREKHTDDMSEEDAKKLMEDCLRACLMRDKTMMNKFQIAKVTAGGLEISEPFQVPMNWGMKSSRIPRSMPWVRGDRGDLSRCNHTTLDTRSIRVYFTSPGGRNPPAQSVSSSLTHTLDGAPWAQTYAPDPWAPGACLAQPLLILHRVLQGLLAVHPFDEVAQLALDGGALHVPVAHLLQQLALKDRVNLPELPTIRRSTRPTCSASTEARRPPLTH